VAIISLGGIVASRSLRLAGDELNKDIINFAREEFNLLLGERTAEEIKIAIGTALFSEKTVLAPMRGRDLVTGLPKELTVDSEQIRAAMSRTIQSLVDSVKVTVEEAPPELVADILEQGILLAGGGALLKGLDKLISDATGIKVLVADDPLTCVVRGTGVVLEDLDALRDVLLPTEFGRS